MKKFRLIVALIFLCNLMLSQTFVFASSNVVEFYVSPDGNDTASGTITQPLKTLEGARSKVRSYKSANGLNAPINVYFMGGNYPITAVTSFDEGDSGTAEFPITYMAYQSQKPNFTGGLYINGSDFQSADELYDRIGNAAYSVKKYDLKANGITKYGIIPESYGDGKDHYDWDNYKKWEREINSIEVFIDDERMDFARYPNFDESDYDNGWLTIGDVIASGATTDWESGKVPVFKYSDTRIEGWDDYTDIHVKGALNYDYFVNDVAIKGIDKTNKTITLADFVTSGVKKNSRYYIYNVLDELDAPGECYIDRTNGILYIYPTTDLANTTVKLSQYEGQRVIATDGASHINFKGLTFELVRGSVFNIFGGDSVTIDGCTFKNIGVKAVWIGKSYFGESDGTTTNNHITSGNHDKAFWDALAWDNKANGVNHTVINCEMFNLGYGGIYMMGGDAWRVEPCNYTVENNRIHDYGYNQSSYDGSAINYYGCGFNIRNNEIYAAPNHAMLGHATKLYIENNEMYDVIRFISDAGAVYTNYFWPINDVHLNYNYIHDIADSDYEEQFTHWNGSIPMRVGIYTDSDMFFPEVKGNVFENMPIGYHNSGNAENVENNIFINVQAPMVGRDDKDHLLGWTPEEAISKTGGLNGITYWPFESTKWRTEYPEFYKWFDEWKKRDDASDWEGVFKNNVLVFLSNTSDYQYSLPGNFLKYTDSETFIYLDNIITKSDVGFTNASGGDYQLKDSSTVYTTLKDFEKIDMSKIGLKTDLVGADYYGSIALMVSSPVAMVSNTLVSVDNENPNVTPQVIDGRTLVPVRFISENLGGEVSWDEDSKKVTILINGKCVELIIGDNNITVDGVTTPMDTSAQIIEGRTMIPLRALVEVGLDKDVYWDESGVIVICDDATMLEENSPIIEDLEMQLS